MKKILLFLLFPLLVNSQTIIMNPECYTTDVEMDSLSDNYYTSNVVLEPLGLYGNLISITIDTSGLSISVKWGDSQYFNTRYPEYMNEWTSFTGVIDEYLILNILSDTINGGTTYLTQNPATSNYGMVFVIDDSYMVFEQYDDSFTRFNGIIASELNDK